MWNSQGPCSFNALVCFSNVLYKCERVCCACLILLVTKQKWWADALKKGRKEPQRKKKKKNLLISAWWQRSKQQKVSKKKRSKKREDFGQPAEFSTKRAGPQWGYVCVWVVRDCPGSAIATTTVREFQAQQVMWQERSGAARRYMKSNKYTRKEKERERERERRSVMDKWTDSPPCVEDVMDPNRRKREREERNWAFQEWAKVQWVVYNHNLG